MIREGIAGLGLRRGLGAGSRDTRTRSVHTLVGNVWSLNHLTCLQVEQNKGNLPNSGKDASCVGCHLNDPLCQGSFTSCLLSPLVPAPLEWQMLTGDPTGEPGAGKPHWKALHRDDTVLFERAMHLCVGQECGDGGISSADKTDPDSYGRVKWVLSQVCQQGHPEAWGV